VNAKTSVLASSISGPILGKAAASWSRTVSQVAATVSGVGLGEDGAEQRRNHVFVAFRHQGEKVAGEVHPAALVSRALEHSS
jgi:hypothetical protein